MTSKFIIKRNRYVDSVSLMSVTDSVKKADGIENCNASMVTAANREILEGLGFDIPADVGANDLVVAVIASDEAAADAALALGQDLLDHKNAASGGKTYDNIEDIDLDEDPYDLVQISLPGEYAAAEAEKALKMGLDVFMFSDNVSLEDEKRLKELAISKGVLMMGPDCGVGYLKGVGLAAGSCYHPGCVGIVGASGSGAQEVGCLVEKLGFGISSLIGTGGRDLYPEIGGIIFCAAARVWACTTVKKARPSARPRSFMTAPGRRSRRQRRRNSTGMAFLRALTGSTGPELPPLWAARCRKPACRRARLQRKRA